MKLLKLRHTAVFYAIALSVGCGSGSSTDSGQETLSVSLTDAPIDEAIKVFVSIKGISINHEDSGWIEHNFDSPKKIDLLTLQYGDSFSLIENVEAKPGEYKVRLDLHVNDDNVPDNSIVLDEGGQEYELFIPSGTQTGLKLDSPIVVPVGGSADYTIDFNVRESIVKRGQEHSYLLKPVLRLVDNSVAGSISGTIADESLMISDCSDDDPLTHNVIYVYEGSDVVPDDIGSVGAQPITTTFVNFDEESGEYRYNAAFLSAGDYTIAFSCNSDLENIETDDELLFKAIENATVTAEAPEK